MERLKSLNLQLHIETSYKTSPIKIKDDRKEYVLPLGKTVHTLELKKISHIEKIEFLGFDPFDKTQKVSLSLCIGERQLDLSGISTFTMENNRYVENVSIHNVSEIFFNGELQLKFFASWFSCNLLQGGILVHDKEKTLWKHYRDYRNPDDSCLNSGQILDKDKNYDVIFSGTCHTGTDHAEYKHKIPYTIQKITSRKISNISFNGLNAYATLENAHTIVDQYQLNTLVLGPSSRIFIPTRKRFLDSVYIFSCVRTEKHMGDFNLFPNIRKENLLYNRKKSSLIGNLIRKKFISLQNKCKKKNISLLVLSFTKNPRDFWHKYKTLSVEMCQNPKNVADLI